MASLDNTDPGHTMPAEKSTAASVQEQAAGIATSVQNSEVGAASAFDSVKNTQFAQDLANGPAATTIKKEANATGNEFSNLANSRKAPSHTAINDTPLTHYHSFFFNLLSWENPRATAITFAAVVSFIFATRYLPVVSWVLKLTWLSLLVVTLTEVITKFTIGSSIATSMRPRKYFKIPKETLEATLDDVEQLINFFVIEAQRVVFAENLTVTAAAFVAAFTSYYLIKLLPAWGFALFSTFIVFLIPLIYTTNKELIDGQLAHASNVVNEQTKQVQELAAQHTSKGLESVKQYAGDYSSVASDYIYKSRQKIPLPATNGSTAVKDKDFPAAPKTDLPASSAEHTKPVVTAPGENEPIAASAL